MFIFSDSTLCRTRQPAWSPGLVATTTSHRLLLIYTGFQYVSKLSTRWWCLCGSVYMMQPSLFGWPLCAGPFRAWSPATTFHGVWDSAGPAHLVSAASPSLDHKHRTICRLHWGHQIRPCAPSSIISRPTCFSNSLRCCWQVGSAPFVRCRCDCLASSAPTINIYTYLLTAAVFYVFIFLHVSHKTEVVANFLCDCCHDRQQMHWKWCCCPCYHRKWGVNGDCKTGKLLWLAQ